jgi:hypothetical protein
MQMVSEEEEEEEKAEEENKEEEAKLEAEAFWVSGLLG